VGIPVAIANRLENPEVAAEVVASGKADFVSIGRGSHAEPEWANKVREGRLGEVRQCIACNVCSDQMLANFPALCSINPEVGLERENAIKPAERRKRVVVIGAGPAGMEAARVLSLRGHGVTLIERHSAPGGLLRYAAKAPRMSELGRVTDFLWHEVNRLGVDICMKTEATLEWINRIAPEAIVVATGSKPMVPPSVVGIDSSNVVSALDVIDGAVTVGQTVLIMGGKLTGCKTAELLAASGRRVILTELEKTLLSEPWLTNSLKHEYLNTLQQSPAVTIRTDTTVEAIRGTSVVVQKDGVCETIEGIDHVVLAVGFDYENELVTTLVAANAAPEVYPVGDCAFPGGSLFEVMHGAARVARMI
jgi:NADPH-dependent 2,4-dienoyl-CoA reductase/sulfur reductase-like enzyme